MTLVTPDKEGSCGTWSRRACKAGTVVPTVDSVPSTLMFICRYRALLYYSEKAQDHKGMSKDRKKSHDGITEVRHTNVGLNSKQDGNSREEEILQGWKDV